MVLMVAAYVNINLILWIRWIERTKRKQDVGGFNGWVEVMDVLDRMVQGVKTDCVSVICAV